ncbi:acyltransferase [Gammaproteobacteria bacterium]|nr:acyltransferase [Gammaproteobacteria bacterium]
MTEFSFSLGLSLRIFKLKYRAEIDGLRALAVVPVILFHAGFELFSGGFVGVDVFFVISGYLITTILIEEIETNRFSMINFYERRARRILPALFFVMLACIPFAWMWMHPRELVDFSQSLVAVSLFASNIFFWQKNGYFAAPAEETPLLHTWSLAIEEQYYLLFPIFLFLAWRFGKNKVFWVIVVLAAISLTLSEWSWRNHATANFYLAPTRAWELFAGSITAFVVQKRGVQANNTLSLIGLTAIVSSIFAYDANTPFPSVYALAPVGGVVLLVLYAGKETLAAKLLSTKAFVGIGLISYSAYLWHQPLFAFARIRLLEAPPPLLMVVLSASSLVLAVVSWKYIENPFRQKTNYFSGRKIIFSMSAVGLSIFVSLGLYGRNEIGFPERNISSSVYESLALTKRESEWETECFDKYMIHERDDWLCRIGNDNGQPSLLVVGDSHALSFLPTIDTAMKELDQSGYFVSVGGCTPLLEIHALRADQFEKNCHTINRRVFNFVRSNNIQKIILVARWTYYTDGGYDGDHFSAIGLQANAKADLETSRNAFEIGLRSTVQSYKDNGVELIIVSQVPQQKQTAFDIYFQSAVTGLTLDELSITRNEHERLQSYVNSLFMMENLKVWDFTDVLCSSDACLVGDINNSYYYDHDHLSLTGSKILVSPTIQYLQANE